MFKGHYQKGFSLVELGVSLTVIAMLVAGIVAGANMKHHYELQQTVEYVGNISQAVKQFKATYGAYPGDMFDAEDKFGKDPITNKYYSSGDGDNAIKSSATGTVDGSPGTVNEQLLFWQQLALAGLIDGTYDGTTNGAGGRMKMPVKYGIFGVNKTASGATYIIGEKAANAGVFSTKDSWDIDTKYDDGYPTTGKFIAADGAGDAGKCINTTPNPDEYKLTNTADTPCIMNFYIE